MHGNVYDYSNVQYTKWIEKVEIICLKHGAFYQSPHAHIDNKQGCPVCNESKGERRIRQYLADNHIEYILQHKFNDCVYKYPLKFDFYIPKYRTIIEYDGIQHFEPVGYFGGESHFIENNLRDDIKNRYIKDNNYKIIRIKYSEYNNIEKIIKEELL